MEVFVDKEKKRLTPRVDANIVRLAKSKAAIVEMPLEGVIEILLAAWVHGRLPEDIFGTRISMTKSKP